MSRPLDSSESGYVTMVGGPKNGVIVQIDLARGPRPWLEAVVEPERPLLELECDERYAFETVQYQLYRCRRTRKIDDQREYWVYASNKRWLGRREIVLAIRRIRQTPQVRRTTL